MYIDNAYKLSHKQRSVTILPLSFRVRARSIEGGKRIGHDLLLFRIFCCLWLGRHRSSLLLCLLVGRLLGRRRRGARLKRRTWLVKCKGTVQELVSCAREHFLATTTMKSTPRLFFSCRAFPGCQPSLVSSASIAALKFCCNLFVQSKLGYVSKAQCESGESSLASTQEAEAQPPPRVSLNTPLLSLAIVTTTTTTTTTPAPSERATAAVPCRQWPGPCNDAIVGSVPWHPPTRLVRLPHGVWRWRWHRQCR